MISKNKLKTLCGIDTLYYFMDISLKDYSNFYDEINANIENQIYTLFEMFYIGSSKGFHWYSLKDKNCSIARIGFKNYTKQRNVKDIYIQLEGSSIYYYGVIETIDIIDKFFGKLKLQIIEKYVSRIDLNIFTNISFAKLDTDWISTLSRSEAQIFTIKSSKEIETIYFGKRQNGKVLRIYNKINEMKKDILNEKNLILSNMLVEKDMFLNYNDSTLWNIELELHRKHIVKKYDISTLDDMFSHLYEVFHTELEKFRILQKDITKVQFLNTNKNKLQELKVWSDIKYSYIKDNLNFCGIYKKSIPYKMSKSALMKQTTDLFIKYNNYQNNDKDKIEIQEFCEDYIEYVASMFQAFSNPQNEEDYKFLDLERFDKWGLLRKKEKILRPFYKFSYDED